MSRKAKRAPKKGKKSTNTEHKEESSIEEKVEATKTKAKAKVPPKTSKVVPTESEAIIEEEYVHTIAPKRTSEHMSDYEYAALISARVAQLQSRSPEWNVPKIPIEEGINGHDPLVIATKEVNQRLVSLVVRRKLPDGSKEDWLLKEMIFPRLAIRYDV
jgi:DNA-directed RNA polymerase subunit K/omega